MGQEELGGGTADSYPVTSEDYRRDVGEGKKNVIEGDVRVRERTSGRRRAAWRRKELVTNICTW